MRLERGRDGKLLTTAKRVGKLKLCDAGRIDRMEKGTHILLLMYLSRLRYDLVFLPQC